APTSGSVTATSQLSTTSSHDVNALPDTASRPSFPTRRSSDLTTITVPSSAMAGTTVSGTVVFSNAGPSTADGVTYTLALTPGLSGEAFPTLPHGVTAT